MLEGRGNRRHTFKLLGCQVVHILIECIAGVHLVLDAVETCHQHRREGQVRVAGAVRKAYLEAIALRIAALNVWHAHTGRPVAGRVGQQYRCFEAGYQAFVGVGAGVRECVDRARVLDDPADIEQGGIGHAGIGVAVKHVGIAREDRLVHVHAVAVVAD